MAQQNSTLSQLQQQFNNLLAGRLSPEEDLGTINQVQSPSQLESAYMSGITFYENMRVRDEIDRQNQLKTTDEMQDTITATLEMLSPEKDKEQYQALSDYRDRVQGLARNIMYHKINPTHALNAVREMKMQYRNEIAPVISAVQEYRTLLNSSIDTASSNPNLMIDKNYLGMSLSDFMKERAEGTEVFASFDPEKAMQEAQQHATALSSRNVITDEQKAKLGDYIRGLQATGYRNSDIGSLKDMLNIMPAGNKGEEAMTVGNLIDEIYNTSGINNGRFSEDQKKTFYNKLVLSFYKGLGYRLDKQYLQDKDFDATRGGGSATPHVIREVEEKSNQADLYNIDKNGRVTAINLGGNTNLQSSIVQQKMAGNVLGQRQLYYLLSNIYNELQDELDNTASAKGGDSAKNAQNLWADYGNHELRAEAIKKIKNADSITEAIKRIFGQGKDTGESVNRILQAIGLLQRPKTSELDYEYNKDYEHNMLNPERFDTFNITDILDYQLGFKNDSIYSNIENTKVTGGEAVDKDRNERLNKAKEAYRKRVFDNWFSQIIDAMNRSGAKFYLGTDDDDSALTVHIQKKWTTNNKEYATQFYSPVWGMQDSNQNPSLPYSFNNNYIKTTQNNNLEDNNQNDNDEQNQSSEDLDNALGSK